MITYIDSMPIVLENYKIKYVFKIYIHIFRGCVISPKKKLLTYSKLGET